jgi:hypothetical protein
MRDYRFPERSGDRRLVGKRLLKCARCPLSDVAEDNGSELRGNYVCNRCRDIDRDLKPETKPTVNDNPII